MKRPSPGPQDRLYAFGSFLADPAEGVLYRDGRPTVLASKSFEVLVVLIERRNRLVPKDELLKLVWADTFVEENNLARHISTLRKALSDHAYDSEYITTMAGRGYRFVAPVREVPRPGLPPVQDAADQTMPPAQAVTDNHGPIASAADTTQPTTTDQPAGRDQFAASAQHSASTELVASPPDVGAAAGVSRRFALICAGLIFAAALVVTATRGMVLPRAFGSSVPDAPDRKLWQLTTSGGLESEPSWAPDSRTVAYSSDRGGNFDIWIQPIASDQPRRLTSSAADDWQPAWSPDGKRVAFRSEREGGGLFVVPSSGGEERRVTQFGYKPQWSNGEQQLLFYDSGIASKLYIVGSDGTNLRRVLADFLSEFTSFRAAWHPDGRRISINGVHKKYGWSFWTLPPLDGSPIRSEIAADVLTRIQAAHVSFSDFRWSPRGDALYLEGRSEDAVNVWRVMVDPQTLAWRSGPERLTTSSGQHTNIVPSPDGTKLAFTVRDERTRVWALPFDSATGQVVGKGEPISPPGIDAVYPEMPPDGTQLVYRTSRRGKQELWKWSQADGNVLRIATADEIHAPRWSSDGSHVAYRRLEKEGTEGAVLLINADGGNPRLLTTPGRTYISPYDWSKDGNWILGACERGALGHRSVCLLPVAGAPGAEKQMRVIASDPERNLYQATFSPDQRWIGFIAATHSTFSTVYVMDANGERWTQITEGGFWDDKPRWASDGKALYFVSNRLGFFDVWGRRFDPVQGKPFGDPFRVTHFESPRQRISTPMLTMDLAIGPHQLILPIVESSGSVWILENVGP